LYELESVALSRLEVQDNRKIRSGFGCQYCDSDSLSLQGLGKLSIGRERDEQEENEDSIFGGLSREERHHVDEVSHFAIRLALCPECHRELWDWWVNRESWLFRRRFMQLAPRVQEEWVLEHAGARWATNKEMQDLWRLKDFEDVEWKDTLAMS